MATGHAVILNVLEKLLQQRPDLAGRVLKVGRAATPGGGGAVRCSIRRRLPDTATAGSLRRRWHRVALQPAGDDRRTRLPLHRRSPASSARQRRRGGMSARNLILMGDQMQLAQPTQGEHPGESGKSCLAYLLEDRAVIPDELGISSAPHSGCTPTSAA
ncbi:MAG: hypothetical protein IPN47_27950 [Gemmatimonadetes bacterium]|nr:hypothetical protein [Gemmatimonadota bacterium]